MSASRTYGPKSNQAHDLIELMNSKLSQIEWLDEIQWMWVQISLDPTCYSYLSKLKKTTLLHMNALVHQKNFSDIHISELYSIDSLFVCAEDQFGKINA